MERRHFAAIFAAVMCGVIGFFPITGREVPLLDLFDLGIHELGHMLAIPFGRFIHTLAGSVVQIAVPAGLAAYFWFGRRDAIGAGFCTAWAGTSAYDVAVYVADAPFQNLPLIGGYHDWAYLLGPGELDALAAAGTIATAIRVGGAIAIGAGILICLRPFIVDWLPATKLRMPTNVRARRDWVLESEAKSQPPRRQAGATGR